MEAESSKSSLSSNYGSVLGTILAATKSSMNIVIVLIVFGVIAWKIEEAYSSVGHALLKIAGAQ